MANDVVFPQWGGDLAVRVSTQPIRRTRGMSAIRNRRGGSRSISAKSHMGALAIQEVKTPLAAWPQEAQGASSLSYHRRIKILGGRNARGEGDPPYLRSFLLMIYGELAPWKPHEAMSGMMFFILRSGGPRCELNWKRATTGSICGYYCCD